MKHFILLLCTVSLLLCQTTSPIFNLVDNGTFGTGTTSGTTEIATLQIPISSSKTITIISANVSCDSACTVEQIWGSTSATGTTSPLLPNPGVTVQATAAGVVASNGTGPCVALSTCPKDAVPATSILRLIYDSATLVKLQGTVQNYSLKVTGTNATAYRIRILEREN